MFFLRTGFVAGTIVLGVVISGCAGGGAATGWSGSPGGDRPTAEGWSSSPVESSDSSDEGAAVPVSYAGSSALLLPVEGVRPEELRDSFHAPRSGGRTHHAIDIPAPRGTPVLAAVDGTITKKGWNSLGGNTLTLKSDDGTTEFYYAHLDSYASHIRVGVKVWRGEEFGTVGSTGNATGPHLHFQVLDVSSDDARPVNPYPLLGGR